ncbi:MAG: hypothetical protein P8188_13060 [Gemmatimonadota bacterium]
MRVKRWTRGLLATVTLLGGVPGIVAGQEPAPSPAADTYLDPVAATLHEAARRNWASIDESVVRYTALIRQRIAAGLRTPLKDRTLYRNELAVRAFWDRDYDALVQVLGARAQYPGRSIAEREGALDWLDDLAFDQPFEPGGDRLFFGLEDPDDEGFEPDNEDFWIAHPLAPGADSLYRFESGDTLTIRLPDGRSLQTVKLDVLPRAADVHRITGSLWIEPESGALVRAVYRLSRQFDAIRDIPDLAEEEARGEFRYVPGLFKPWTFDMTMVAIDYGFWNFQVWLPRAMRVEGEAAAGILKFPVSLDVSYRVESVTTEQDLAEAPDPTPAQELRTRHFDSRAEAMEFLAQLMTDQDGVRYEPLSELTRTSGGRTSRYVVPEDRARLASSPHLPPPIWEEEVGFVSDRELEEYVSTLADLPTPPVNGLPWTANWGWDRADLLRYNKVEGPALGGTFEFRTDAGFLGPMDVRTEGFFGFGDLEPKVRLDLEWASVTRRLTLGGFRELRPVNTRARNLGPGNSLNALLFGRDFGEYFMATGADFRWRPPEAARQSFELRVYGERHHALSNKVEFALFHAFDSDWSFSPNVQAQGVEEAGAEIWLSPWWGTDPLLPQFGLELYAHGGAWRLPRATEGITDDAFVRASAILRAAIPVASGRWRVGGRPGAPPLPSGAGSWEARRACGATRPRWPWDRASPGAVRRSPGSTRWGRSALSGTWAGRDSGKTGPPTISCTGWASVGAFWTACFAWTFPTGSTTPWAGSGLTSTWTRSSEAGHPGRWGSGEVFFPAGRRSRPGAS